MPKIHQVLAIEQGERTRSERALTEHYKKLQKTDLFKGHAKSYVPNDEEGEELPPDNKKVQVKAREFFSQVENILSPIWNLTATKEWANYSCAGANIEIDGQVLCEDVPIPYLLFMKKQLDNLETELRKIPVLDPDKNWTFSPEQNCYVTPMTWTHRTEKRKRAMSLAPATQHHKEQVEIISEDINVGRWQTVNHSGALPAQEKDEFLERIRKLKNAVVSAREKANEQEVTKKDVAASLFGYIFSL